MELYMVIDFIGWMSQVLSNLAMPVLAVAAVAHVIWHRA